MLPLAAWGWMPVVWCLWPGPDTSLFNFEEVMSMPSGPTRHQFSDFENLRSSFIGKSLAAARHSAACISLDASLVRPDDDIPVSENCGRCPDCGATRNMIATLCACATNSQKCKLALESDVASRSVALMAMLAPWQ